MSKPKPTELITISAWEDKLEASRFAIEMLEIQAAQMDIESKEYEELMDLIQEANLSLSSAYAVLACRKAKLGIVGKSWYGAEKDG